MNVLILSAYDADSHQQWHQGLVRHLDHDISVMTLPARYFSWRIRGNALSWALGHLDALTAKPWDAIIATSMVDLATLKGLVPQLAAVPTFVYFHENQFAYPTTAQSHKSLEPQMVSLYSALAANKIIFNSHYNQQTFLNGVDALLKKLPDQVPAGVHKRLQQKSAVIPVPIKAEFFDLAEQRSANADENRPLTIVWNHRWEYDKGPELLLAIVEKLSLFSPALNLRCHVVGQQFRQVPDDFRKIKDCLVANSWLGAWGYLPADEYRQLLQQSDLVLSTAHHDFQGLAIMEAVAAGCVPVLPDRVAYPDFFSRDYLYAAPNDVDQQAQNACAKILDFRGVPIAVPKLRQYSWQSLTPQYEQLLATLATESYL